jgi:hypothetical protein
MEGGNGLDLPRKLTRRERLKREGRSTTKPSAQRPFRNPSGGGVLDKINFVFCGGRGESAPGRREDAAAFRRGPVRGPYRHTP